MLKNFTDSWLFLRKNTQGLLVSPGEGDDFREKQDNYSFTLKPKVAKIQGADTSNSGPPFVACARGGGARGRPAGRARSHKRVLSSFSPAPCSGPRPDTDGARAYARRAPGVVVQPRLAPGATGARGVNGSPLQLHLHLAAVGALRHGCAAHQRRDQMLL